MCWGGNPERHPGLRAAAGFWPPSCRVSCLILLVHLPHSLVSSPLHAAGLAPSGLLLSSQTHSSLVFLTLLIFTLVFHVPNATHFFSPFHTYPLLRSSHPHVSFTLIHSPVSRASCLSLFVSVSQSCITLISPVVFASRVLASPHVVFFPHLS